MAKHFQLASITQYSAQYSVYRLAMRADIKYNKENMSWT